MGSYVFRWPYPANDVHLTGTFDDWAKSIQMDKVGDGWEKEVDLPSADDKVLYKFIVNNEWIVDERAPKEGDGHYNTNNVLLPEQIKRKPAAASTEDVPGAFPETPSDEHSSFGVAPIPVSSGTGNPVQVPAGSTLPGQKDISSNTIGSGVTTSKDDYEKVGSSATSAGNEASEYSINPIPATSGTGNPVSLPAGAPVPDSKDISTSKIDSAVTTSKDEYEKVGSSADDSTAFSVTPIPASSGIGNPISLPAGASIPDQKDITGHSVDSTVTTSKEDYEKAGSSAFPAAALAAGAGAIGGAGLASAFSVPSDKKNLIPESSLPMGTAKTDTLDAGPFISSSGPGTTTAELASKVPLEEDLFTESGGPDLETTKLASELEIPLRSGRSVSSSFSAAPSGARPSDPTIRSSGAGTTTADLASRVPLENDSTARSTGAGTTTSDIASKALQESGIAGVAGASGATAAVIASKALEGSDPTIRSSGPGTTTADLAGKVPLESDSTIKSSGPGTTTAALAGNVPVESSTVSSVPDVVKESIQSAHESPEATASTEAVEEKSEVEKELLSKTPITQATDTAADGVANAPDKVPAVVTESISKAHESPEAAASSEAIKEKSDVEKELLSKTPTSPATTEPTSKSNASGPIAAATAGVAGALGALGAAVGISSTTGATKESSASDAAGTPGAINTSGVPDMVKESISSAHGDPEAASSPEAVKDKSDFEKELLTKTPTSQATGEPASAAAQQYSYYGLATSVPEPVEKSMQQAHAAPEAAADSSVVAEKAVMERELLHKIPSTSEAGEPAPTIAAATSSTAPTSTSTAAAATTLTDGKTANEPVPDTDTSSAARGPSAGELAGGAAVGGAAAAGVAALAQRHNDADIEPPRIADSQKPAISTEASPATTTQSVLPGHARSAAAAVSDGSSGSQMVDIPKSAAPVETTEGATTEYAPVRTGAHAPGVSSAAAAALADGTEDPTLTERAPLAEEPAVKMMNQNDGLTDSAGLAGNKDSAIASGVAGGTTGSYVPSTIHDATTTSSTGVPLTSPIAGSSVEPSGVATAFPVTGAATDSTTAATSATAGLGGLSSKEMTGGSTTTSAPLGEISGNKDPSALVAAAGIPSLTSAGTAVHNVAETSKDERKSIEPSSTAAGSSTATAPSTPAKKTTQASTAASPAVSTAASTGTDNTEKRKKKHRLSKLYHKIFD